MFTTFILFKFFCHVCNFCAWKLYDVKSLFCFEQSTVAIEGRTWAMCEVTSGESPTAVDKPDPPTVVTQHSQPPRQFVLLSAQVISEISFIMLMTYHLCEFMYISMQNLLCYLFSINTEAAACFFYP